MTLDDTIAAIATPPGVGGIAVVRVSGPEAIQAVDSIFDGHSKLIDSPTHRAHYGLITDRTSAERVDTVLVTIMRGPQSYTGEDTAEISCHGGQLNTRRILDLVLQNGVRMADPGEFTRRAYLNGRMDLAQVEAVADLIHAKTEAARRSSANQIIGVLSEEVKTLRGELIKICSLMEIDLDFAEENLIDIGRDKILSAIGLAKTRIESLLNTYAFGHLLREGAHVNIVGPPNVGKSSLLNALIKRNRAIVSDVPGTTRDYIEEGIDLDGLPVLLRDTAGLRKPGDAIESMGIDLTTEYLGRADLNILVIDSSQPYDDQAVEVERAVRDCNVPVLACLNKIDKSIDVDQATAQRFTNRVRVSAKTLDGIDQLREEIRKQFASDISYDSPMISRLRHKDALARGLGLLASAEATVLNKVSNEFASVDVRAAIECLGELIGEVTSTDVLNDIFSNFCIGK